MIFHVRSEVLINGIGRVVHEHDQEFEDDSNVFGRVLEYRQYMRRTFPGCEFKLVESKQID